MAKYNKDSKPLHDLVLGIKPRKSLVSQWTFKAKMIAIDDITLPVIASTTCKNARTFRMQKLNNSLAKKPISTQDANKCATWILDTKDKKADLQSLVKD